MIKINLALIVDDKSVKKVVKCFFCRVCFKL